MLASDGKKGLCRICNKTFSKLGNAKAHFQKTHVEQLPMNCPICHHEFPSRPKCDQHVIKDHKITLAELKKSTFFALTEDGLSGLTLLENGKVICTVCSVAFSKKGNGKSHFLKKHCISEQRSKPEINDDGNILNGHSGPVNPEEFETNQEFVPKVEMPEVGESMMKSDLGNNDSILTIYVRLTQTKLKAFSLKGALWIREINVSNNNQTVIRTVTK